MSPNTSTKPKSAEEIAEKAGTQYGVIKSLCYPELGATSIERSVDTFSQRTTTHAETDGNKLTKINAGFFQKADAETQFIVLLHEVSHTGDGVSFGKGKSGHTPDFWEEFQDNFRIFLNDNRAKRTVETLFGGILTEFSWKRAKYRAVQHVSQVDNRSETLDERREKMADALDYDNYNEFEDGDWGLQMYGRDENIHPDETTVNIFTGTKRYADDFSDEELLEFVEEHGGSVPMPLIVLDINEYRGDGPQLIDDDDQWKVMNYARQDSKKALAVQERLGHGYTGLCVEMVAMSPNKSDWENATPINIENFPSPDQIEREIKYF